MVLRVSDIRKAVRKLKKNNISPIDGFYFAQPHPMTLIDMLLTYKRPRATRLYKQMRRSYETVKETKA